MICAALAAWCAGEVSAQVSSRGGAQRRVSSSRPQAAKPAPQPSLFLAPERRQSPLPEIEWRRESPRTPLVSYNSAALAVAGNPLASSYVIDMSGEWKVKALPEGGFDPAVLKGSADGAGWAKVSVPQKQPLATPIAVYRKEFKVPFAWVERAVFVRVESVNGPFELYVNGQKAGAFTDPCAVSEFDITPYVSDGKNEMAVVVRSGGATSVLQDNISHTAGTFIARGIQVISQPKLRLMDYVYSVSFSEFNSDATLYFGAVMKTGLLNKRTTKVYIELYSPSGEKISHASQDVTLGMKGEDTVKFYIPVPAARMWSHESPELYTVQLRTQYEGRFGEYMAVKVGLRRVEMRWDGLFLNGKKVNMRAVKYAPAEGAQIEKDILRFKAADVNMLLLSGCPRSEEIYSLCDRYGLYVCPQANIDTRRSGLSRELGGTPANDPKWGEAYVQRALSAYCSSQGHPCAVMFSIGGQGGNGYNLYESYLRLKKAEASRPIVYEWAAGEWNTDIVISGGGAKGEGAASARTTASRPEINYYDISYFERPERRDQRVAMRMEGRSAIEITNNSLFDDLSGAELRCEVTFASNKKPLNSVPVKLGIAPGAKAVVEVPELKRLKKGGYTVIARVVRTAEPSIVISTDRLRVE